MLWLRDNARGAIFAWPIWCGGQFGGNSFMHKSGESLAKSLGRKIASRSFLNLSQQKTKLYQRLNRDIYDLFIILRVLSDHNYHALRPQSCAAL